MSRRLQFVVFATALTLSGSLWAGADTPVLPGNGFDASRYQGLWTKSPFAVASDDSTSTSPDYSLVGIAEIEGISYASLIDKQSQEHFLLCSDKPARGLTLISIKHGQNIADNSVIIQKKNGESITLKLEATASTPSVIPLIPMPGSTVAPQGAYPGQVRRSVFPGQMQPGVYPRQGPPPAPFHPRIIVPPPRPLQPTQQ
jgi:hypothetical protein